MHPASSSSQPQFQQLAECLERWFALNSRALPWRHGYDPYQVWVSEVMAQQTRLEVVVPYFIRFLNRFPTVERLAAAPIEDVLSAWSGLGYYRRARTLHAGAAYLTAGRNGELPRELSGLLKVPGVGRYTAGAIRSIGYDEPAPIVDGNVERVLSRLFALHQPAGGALLRKTLWSLAEALVAQARSPRAMNQGMMELGALVCRPKAPRCEVCPVAVHCAALQSGDPESFPGAKQSRQVEQHEIDLYLVTSGGRILLHRLGGRLMRGMYLFPAGPNDLFEMPASAEFVRGRKIGTMRHTITHRRITFHVYEAQLRSDVIAEESSERVWAELPGLAGVPHPSIVKKALKLAGW